MSTGRDFSLDQAQEIARRCYAVLAPFCDSLQLVGSVRRKKAIVHDIEFLCIAKTAPIADLFGAITGSASAIEANLHRIRQGFGAILIKDGPKLKTFLTHEGIPVEVNICAVESWPVELVIKTGPADFSRKTEFLELLGLGWIEPEDRR